MSNIRIFAMLIFIVLPDLGFGKILDNQDISVGKISDSEIFVQKSDSQHRCKIDQKLINVKLSSDEKAVIISGTSYIPVAELMQCNPVRMIHAKMAAPHVGFLSDINLRAGLYASLLPVAVNPLSFVAIVAQIGSDRNLVTSPGFYRKKISISKLLSEASSDISPVISIDARYVSLQLHSCESDKPLDVVEIRTNKRVQLNRASCNKLFNYG
jgi:hypothetical protein